MKNFIYCLIFSASLLFILNQQIDIDKLLRINKILTHSYDANINDSIAYSCIKCGNTKILYLYEFDVDTINNQRERRLNKKILYSKQ